MKKLIILLLAFSLSGCAALLDDVPHEDRNLDEELKVTAAGAVTTGIIAGVLFIIFLPSLLF